MRTVLLALAVFTLPTSAYAGGVVVRDHRSPPAATPQVTVRDHRSPPAATPQVTVRDHRTQSAPVTTQPRPPSRQVRADDYAETTYGPVAQSYHSSTYVHQNDRYTSSNIPVRLQVDGWTRGSARTSNLAGVGIQVAAQLGHGYVGSEAATGDQNGYSNGSFWQVGGLAGLLVPVSPHVRAGGEVAAGMRRGPLGDRYFDTRAKVEAALLPTVAIGASIGLGWQVDREAYGAIYLALRSR